MKVVVLRAERERKPKRESVFEVLVDDRATAESTPSQEELFSDTGKGQTDEGARWPLRL